MVFWLDMIGMFCWGIAPLFAKMALNDVSPIAGLILRTFFAFSLLSGWFGIGGSYVQIKSIPLNLWMFLIIESLLATVVGDLAYFAAIKKGEISMVTIIMSSSPLVTMVGAAIFLNEQITFIKIVGALLVICGIVLVIQ